MGKFARWSAPEGLSLHGRVDARGLLRWGDRPPLRRAGGGAAAVGRSAAPAWRRRLRTTARDGRRAGGKRAVAPRAGLHAIQRSRRKKTAVASSAAKRINMSRPTSPPSNSGLPAACRKSGARAWATRRRRTGSTPCSRRSTRRRARRKPPERQKGGGHAAQPQTEALLERGELPLERQVRGHALGQDVSGLLRHPPPPACAGGQAGAGGASGQHARHLGAQRARAHARTLRRADGLAPARRRHGHALWPARTLSGRGQQTACGPPARRVHQVLLRRRGGLLGARGVRDAQKPPGQGVFLLSTAPATPEGRGTGSRSSSIRARTSFPSSTASTTTPFCRRACARR